MIDAYVIRFTCSISETHFDKIYVTEGTDRDNLHIETDLQFRTDDDTIIFFSRSTIIPVIKELHMIVSKNHTLFEVEFTPNKVYITSEQAQYTANKPLHWLKKL